MQAFRTAVATALLFGLVAPATRAQETAPGQAPRQIQVTILGMSCPFCTYGVQQKLRKLEGVEKLEVVLETGLATLQLRDGADLSNELLRKTVKDAGFEVTGIVRDFESEYPDVSPPETD